MGQIIDLSFWHDGWMAAERDELDALLTRPTQDGVVRVRACRSLIERTFLVQTGLRKRSSSWGSLLDLRSSGSLGFDWRYAWGSGLDHPECYTSGKGRKAGERYVIVHNYRPGPPEFDPDMFAAQQLPWSWYNPSATNAFLIVANAD